MSLERYWRPMNDTGYGFHYYPDAEHYSPYDLRRWLPELKSLGASWLVVPSRLSAPIPEFFIKGLVEDEIEPIVHVMTPSIRSVDRSALAELLGRYAAWGIHYVEVLSEANCAERWPVRDWCQPSLVERFVEMLAPCLEDMHSAGLHPVFPALRPGGDYWDLSFLQSSLELLASMLEDALLQSMVIGMHNHGFDRPVSWGEGGRERWSEARPYSTPEGSQDHMGHHLFEWYNEVAAATLGDSLGLLSMGAAVLGEPYSPSCGVWTDGDLHAERALAIANGQMDGAVPPYVINHSFWLLATEDEDSYRAQAWYSSAGEECQAVSAMKGLLKHARSGKDKWPLPDPPSPASEQPTGVDFIGLSQEMMDALRIEAAQRPNEPYWKVTRVEVRPGTQNMSAFAIADADAVRFSWPDGEHVATQKDDPYAPEGAREGAASMPMFAAWGAYSAEVVGNSQILHGFGLYGDRLELTDPQNHPVLATFQLVDPSGKDPAPAPPQPLDPPAPAPQPPDPPAPAPRPPAGYKRFSRPPRDNGMGIHFGLNTTSEAIALDIARAKEMRMTWATLCYQGEEQLLRAGKMIWDAGIMPVCRQILPINRRHPFGRDARLLLENGVPAYIQIFNEPSDEREWEHGRPRDYLAKWSDLWAEKARDVYDSGGYAGLQCLSLEEAEAAIDALGVHSPIWQRVWFCAHNYGLNHPPEWQEGLWSVLGFQFFADVFQRRLGFVPPIICGEGGWLYGAYDDHRYPRVDGELHAKYTKAMYKWFRKSRLSNGELLPAYLFAVCPWILSGPSDEAWYGYTTKEMTIWAVKSIKEFVRFQSASADGREEG